MEIRSYHILVHFGKYISEVPYTNFMTTSKLLQLHESNTRNIHTAGAYKINGHNTYTISSQHPLYLSTLIYLCTLRFQKSEQNNRRGSYIYTIVHLFAQVYVYIIIYRVDKPRSDKRPRTAMLLLLSRKRVSFITR